MMIRALSRQAPILTKEVTKRSLRTASLTPRFAKFLSEIPSKNNSLKDLERKIKASLPPLPKNDFAKSKTFGDKHATQLLMHALFSHVPDIQVKVPEMEGVSSQQIEAFLEEEAPEVLSNWEELKALCKDEASFKEDPLVKKLLEDIRVRIEESFSKESGFKKLDICFLEKWLKKLESSNQHLMVRSSGAEDSKQVTNAGGNVSVAYVPPKEEALLEAIGKVVRSYFGIESLQNRWNATENPFQKPLQLSVTLQKLIGEQAGQVSSPHLENIPTAFTLFSNEPLYIGGEAFRVMKIAATFGHGEGIVKSADISSDSVLVLVSEAQPDKLYYFYDHKLKPLRKGPVETKKEIALESLPNPEALSKKRALTEDQIVALYMAGVATEHFLEKGPLDVEGVIEQGQIYFVQARDIKSQALIPTYLSQKGTEVKQAKIILPGAASVLSFSSTEEILFASTLKQAEDLFSSSKHKLVVVRHMERSKLSHSFVNFKGLGIPCLCVEHGLDEFLKDLSTESPLVVDLQTALLHRWGPSLPPLEECIVKGLSVHPAKIAHSLNVPSKELLLPLRKQEAEDLKCILSRLHQASSKEEKLLCLERIIEHPKLKSFSSRVEEMLILSEGCQKTDLYLAPLLELKKEISEILEEARSVLEKEGGRFQELFIIKSLEVLLLGSDEKDKGAIGQYSLADVDTLFEMLSSLIYYQKSLTHPSSCADLLLYGKMGSDEAFEGWEQFLRSLEEKIYEGQVEPKSLEKLKWQLKILHETGALPFWLTFLQSPKSCNGPVSQLEQITSQLTEKDREILSDLLKKQQEIQQLKEKMALFSSREGFEQLWPALRSLIQEIGLKKWLASLTQSSLIVQVMGGQVLRSLIAVFDESVKTVKSSPAFGGTVHVELFKRMLQVGYNLMMSLTDKLISKEIHHIGCEMERDSPWESLFGIGDILRNCPTNTLAQLMPSQGFSVNAAMIGSPAYFTRHEPQHLEDVFTLIHQNLLATLSLWNLQQIHQAKAFKSFIPLPLKDALRKIRKTFEEPWILLNEGMQVSSKELVQRYALPLQYHGCLLEVHFDLSSQELILKASFVGQARNRWKDIGDWFSTLEELGILTAKTPLYQNDSELTVFWSFSSPEAFDLGLEELKTALGYSYSYGGNPERFIQIKIEFWRDREESVDILNYLMKTKHPYAPHLERQLMSSVNPKIRREMLRRILEKSIASSEEALSLFKEWSASSKQTFSSMILQSLKEEGPSLQKALLHLLTHSLKQAHESSFLRQQIQVMSKAVLQEVKSSDEAVKQEALYLFQALKEKGKFDEEKSYGSLRSSGFLEP
jgi:hypothetical protein